MHPLLQFGLLLFVVAAVFTVPLVVLSERSAPRMQTGPTAIDAAISLMQRTEGDKVAREMADFKGLKELEAGNAEILAKSRKSVDNALGTLAKEAETREERWGVTPSGDARRTA